MKAAVYLGGLVFGVACGVSLGARANRRRFSFRGKSVLITGGSRGLGLVMARRLAREGARLVIVARNEEGLHRAEEELRALGAEVLAIACDVSDQAQVEKAVERTVSAYGGVDVVINNAGVIQVGPLDHMTVKDFEDALAIHLYGPLFTTNAVLPHMRRSGGGRIVNISSIGGKIAVPHLLPYSVSKFALVGLSDGLRAELRKENIFVTTVCPGLMRTGSPRNAFFKGRHRKEFAWFTISDSLPLLSISADCAARKILEACRRGAARLIVSTPAKAGVLLNELLPGVTTSLLSAANRLLPGPDTTRDNRSHAGNESESALAPSLLTRLSEKAALRNNQVA
ncbi:MAG TPA: SDR family oxidoreductase [Verrucomicrobiae bacterium]|nr:SDR family oxidoreductase [Verrucomicrobiae bacterium]